MEERGGQQWRPQQSSSRGECFSQLHRWASPGGRWCLQPPGKVPAAGCLPACSCRSLQVGGRQWSLGQGPLFLLCRWLWGASAGLLCLLQPHQPPPRPAAGHRLCGALQDSALTGPRGWAGRVWGGTLRGRAQQWLQGGPVLSEWVGLILFVLVRRELPGHPWPFGAALTPPTREGLSASCRPFPRLRSTPFPWTTGGWGGVQGATGPPAGLPQTHAWTPAGAMPFIAVRLQRHGGPVASHPQAFLSSFSKILRGPEGGRGRAREPGGGGRAWAWRAQ